MQYLLLMFNYKEFSILNTLRKAKYKIVEPYYMEGSTPDGPVLFSGSLHCITKKKIPLALGLVVTLVVILVSIGDLESKSLG
jgi:hypothetical protein